MALVVMTRLAVTYEIMPEDELRQVVRLAHAKGIPVYVDDAGGARVGPAIFDQPRTLQLGVDVVATGLDKYGTVGPRLGVMAGEKSLVSRIRACAFEMGLEARPLLYPAAVRSLVGSTAERVQELVETTRDVATAIKDVLGERLHETPVIAELRADDILEMGLERAGLRTPPIVPYEASAALAMLLLQGLWGDHRPLRRPPAWDLGADDQVHPAGNAAALRWVASIRQGHRRVSRHAGGHARRA